jgi:UDP-N-acetylmuramate dehydrogenase
VTDKLAIQENIPLAPLTTLGIGGPARFFVEARSEAEVVEALIWAEEHDLPTFILGGGSNILVADEGFPGLVLRVAIKGTQLCHEGENVIITAGAGEEWDAFVSSCVKRKLAGIECLSGIPGWVGGTPVQNVGAYGQEVSETILTVRVYDRQEKKVVELSKAECGFSYRTSIFNTSARDRYVVLAVTYALAAHGRPTIRYAEVQDYFAAWSHPPSLAEVRQAVRSIRARKAMLLTPGDPDSRSVGSFFKNPVLTAEALARIEASARARGILKDRERVPRYETSEGKVKVPAAWLIERSGFAKGYRRGRAGLSTKHALAIINRGGATAREVIDFQNEIQQRVEEQFGIRLVPEPVFVGF